MAGAAVGVVAERHVGVFGRQEREEGEHGGGVRKRTEKEDMMMFVYVMVMAVREKENEKSEHLCRDKRLGLGSERGP